MCLPLVSDDISEEQHNLIEQHAREYIEEVDANSNGSVELIEFLDSFKLFMKHVNMVLVNIRESVNKKKNLSGEDFESLPDEEVEFDDDEDGDDEVEGELVEL